MNGSVFRLSTGKDSRSASGWFLGSRTISSSWRMGSQTGSESRWLMRQKSVRWSSSISASSLLVPLTILMTTPGCRVRNAAIIWVTHS